MVSLEQKRISNISEYIVQVYQAEEQLRSCDLDIDAVFREHIEDLAATDEEKALEKQWYSELLEEMKRDGVEKNGHLARINAIVKELSEIHFHLLKSDRTYRGHFDQAKLHINRFQQAYGGELMNPIQICLDGVYLFKRKRSQQESLDEQFKAAIPAFVELCGYLSYRYKSKHENDEE